jgi:phage protein D
MNARTPDFRLIFEGTDITEDVSDYLIEATYVDFLHGKSDTLNIKLEDVEGLWRGAWSPARGNTFSFELGYVDEGRMPSGSFRVDDIAYDGPPDTVSISGLAAAITLDLRTKRTRAFENKSFEEIANTIAGEHGLVLFGDVPNIRYDRKTQNDESDVEFLKRLATDYGLAFSVRDRSVVFHDLDVLERETPVMSFTRSGLKRYGLREKSRRIYRAAEIQYRSPQTGELITHREEVEDIINGDTLVIRERVENLGQAEARSRAALEQANRQLNRGFIVLEGEQRALSGNIIEITELGRKSGNFLIEKATHTYKRPGGYITRCEVRRVS